MEENSKIAYSEIYAILNLLEDNALSKIPKKVINFINEERDLKYKVKIDLNKPLEKQEFQRKTIVLLAILNLNYWCDSEEEKNVFLEELKINSKLEKKVLEEKYDSNSLFKKEKNIKDTKNLQLINYKEKNFIRKILDKFRNLFKKFKNEV